VAGFACWLLAIPTDLLNPTEGTIADATQDEFAILPYQEGDG
jgi:hypothetical protein